MKKKKKLQKEGKKSGAFMYDKSAKELAQQKKEEASDYQLAITSTNYIMMSLLSN
jgi:hypothetical protein